MPKIVVEQQRTIYHLSDTVLVGAQRRNKNICRSRKAFLFADQGECCCRAHCVGTKVFGVVTILTKKMLCKT